jgi:hypothetical protein
MITSNLKLQKSLEEYVELFESATSRSLSLYDSLLDEGFIFEDPYHKSIGIGGFKSLMQGRFALYEKTIKDKSRLRYRVHDFIWGRREDVAYMYWSMIFSIAKGKDVEEKSFEGMSEITLSKNGKILSQCDFWGRHEAFDVKGYKLFKQ